MAGRAVRRDGDGGGDGRVSGGEVLGLRLDPGDAENDKRQER